MDLKQYQTSMSYNPVDGKPMSNTGVTGGTVIFRGVASGGSEISIIDSTKNIETDLLANQLVKVNIGGVDYIRKIISNRPDTLTIATLGNAISATADLGSGTGGQGKITLKAEEAGIAGNAYSVALAEGTGVSAALAATLDEETKVLTITSPTDEAEVATAIVAADVVALINADPVISLVITADLVFTAGSIPVTATGDFSGGLNAIVVTAGTVYEVF